MALVKSVRELRFLGSRVTVWTNTCDVQIQAQPSPDKVVVFLHGSGITGFGMKKWMAKMVTPPPDLVMILPSAPMREYKLDGKRSCVWHQREDTSIRGDDEDLEGIDEMCEGLDKLVDDVKSIGVDDLTLGGFSMGGHLALHAVYRANIRVNKCFCLSSWLINKSAVYDGRMSDSPPPLYMVHGEQDRIVPLDWATTTRDRLAMAGVKTRMVTYKGLEHTLNTDVLDDLFWWISNEENDM